MMTMLSGRRQAGVTSPALDRNTILQAVSSWPRDEQLALARAIWEQVGAGFVEEPIAPPDSRGLAGLIARAGTPPTDEDVARWLDEHRLEKYGR